MVITVPGRAARRIVQIGGGEPRLPVMRVHDVRREARARAPCRSSAATAPGRRSGARCPASRGRPGRHRDCPAGRTDAAHRAPAGRARRRCRPAAAAGPPKRSPERRTVARRSVSAPHHRGIARHQRADLDALRRQRRRQRADDIGQAAGLDQRERSPRRPPEPRSIIASACGRSSAG